MNLPLLILAATAFCASLVLYAVALRQRSRLIQSQKQLDELRKTLGESQADLTQSLKEAKDQDELEHLAGLILPRLDHGVICIDRKGAVRYINPYAEKLLGSSAEGKLYSEVLQSLKIGGKQDFSPFEAALKGKSQTLPDTAELVTKYGTFPINAILTPISPDEEEPFVALFFADNSRNANLLTEEKSFFSGAVHELRTPLSVIRFAASLLATKFETLDKEKVRDNLKNIGNASSQMVELINNFLNVSRIDQGRLEVEKTPFDIVSLTDEVLSEMSDLAKERKLFVNHEVVEEHRMVLGNKLKAKEVLTNLISNAIKYTMQGGLTITHRRNQGMLLTKVSDTGKGIPSASQRLLFRRFMQIGSGRRESVAKSTGLGLYISKTFAQLMGGDVVLESSKPGKGSTFTFSLPVG